MDMEHHAPASTDSRAASLRREAAPTHSSMSLKKIERDYEALLRPDDLRASLVRVALYVLAYESFRDGAIDHVRMLFMHGIDASGWKIDEPEYQRKVLSRHKSPFRASLDWYQEMGALDPTDLVSIDHLTSVRNRLVHELSDLIGTKNLAPALDTFTELLRVYRKLEVWRVINLELAGDPDWEGKEIDEDEVAPGPMLMMRMLIDVALGKDDEAWSYYGAMVKGRGEREGTDPRAT